MRMRLDAVRQSNLPGATRRPVQFLMRVRGMFKAGAGIRQHQFPQFHSAQCQHAIRNRLEFSASTFHHNDFQAVIMIEMHMRSRQHHCSCSMLNLPSTFAPDSEHDGRRPALKCRRPLCSIQNLPRSASRIRSRNASERFAYPRLAISRSNSFSRSSSSETPVLLNCGMAFLHLDIYGHRRKRADHHGYGMRGGDRPPQKSSLEVPSGDFLYLCCNLT